MAMQRDSILACACGLCLQQGLEGFSMRKLARELGVTAPALYRHYGSKEEVLLDVVNEAYRLQMEYLSRALVGATPLERFELAGQAYMDFALEQPRFYELLYTYAEMLGLDEIPEGTQARARAVGQFWRDRVRELMAEGFLEEGDPAQVSVTMWAFAHGLLSLYLRGLLPLDEERFRMFVDVCFSRFLCGLATDEFAAAIAEQMRESGAEEALVGALDPEVLAERAWPGQAQGAGTAEPAENEAGNGGRTAAAPDAPEAETSGPRSP